MPKISVIIPVYNSEKYLNKCLDSVFSQTFDDFELIIVNDGSPDNSQDIIDAYKALHPGKTTAIRQENSGQAAARNRGLDLACGEFIIFVDSDDYLHPEAFAKTLDFASDKELDVVCFEIANVVNGQIADSNWHTMFSEDPIRRYLLNEASPCNKLIRRSFLEENNLRFTVGRIYEDLELIAQFVLYTSKIGFLDEQLYYYIIHENSTMQQPKYNPKLASIYPVMETLKAKFNGSEFADEIEYVFIEHLLHAASLRFLAFPEGKEDLIKISCIMKENFPKWHKNKYYKTQGSKYRIFCTLAYMRQYGILKLLLKK